MIGKQISHQGLAALIAGFSVALFGLVACTNDDGAPVIERQSQVEATPITGEIELASPTPLSISGQIPPSPTPTPVLSPTPIPESEQQAITDEYLARCAVYVRNNEQPVTYYEFAELDPQNMTDLERVIWAEEIGRREYCRDYWSEPLSIANADKRNESYRNSCYESLWRQHTDFIQRSNREDDYIRFDQAARIANWLDIPSDALVSMDPSPLELALAAREQGQQYEEEDYEAALDNEWFGLVPGSVQGRFSVTGPWPRNPFEVGPTIGDTSATDDCVRYYPQLFIGRWIPLDTAITRQAIQEYLATRTPTPVPDDFGEWVNQRDRQVYVG